MLNIDSPFSDKQPLYGSVFLCPWMPTSWTDFQHWVHRASAITIWDAKCIFSWKFPDHSCTSNWKIPLLIIKSFPQVKSSPKRINAYVITRLRQTWSFIGFIFSHGWQEWMPRQEKIGFLFMWGEISNYIEISGQILPHSGFHLCLQRCFLGWLRFFFSFNKEMHASVHILQTITPSKLTHSFSA